MAHVRTTAVAVAYFLDRASKRQVPNGDPDLVCPLHKASMDKVCSRCPWWQSLKGRHPQTGEEIDRWDCAIALLPLLLINTANEARQGAAATVGD